MSYRKAMLLMAGITLILTVIIAIGNIMNVIIQLSR